MMAQRTVVTVAEPWIEKPNHLNPLPVLPLLPLYWGVYHCYIFSG